MISIDLSGPEGNSFAIAAMFRDWSKQLGLPPVDPFEGAESYEDLLDKFDAHFKARINYKFINDPR